MRSFWAVIMFLAIVLSIYFAMNSYVLFRLGSMLAIRRGIGFYLLLFSLTFSFIVASGSQAFWANGAIRLFYTLSAIWFGMVFWLVLLVLASDSLRLFIKIPPKPTAIIILIIVSLTTIYAFFNTRRLTVRTIAVEAPLTKRLVQLSDIHLGSISPAQFSRIIDRTNSLNPDLVFITGDLVDNMNSQTRSTLKQLDRISAPVFFITGNHERYVGVDRVVDAIKDTRVRFLRNQSITHEGLQIIGLDDSTQEHYLPLVLSSIPLDPHAFKVLLFHRPDHPETIQGYDIDLMLAGHTHNGQIFPFNLFARLRHKYLWGLYRFGKMQMVVSCGTGFWGPPLRLGSRCEIIAVELGKHPTN